MENMLKKETKMNIIKKIEDLEKSVQLEFLSRWKFERFLDELAKLLHQYFQDKLKVDLGCSLLYLLEKNYYCLGGVSSQRLESDRSSCFYDLNEKQSRESFTGFSLIHNVFFILDDFQVAANKFKPHICHVAKNCELPEKRTQSFFSIPAFESNNRPNRMTDNDPLPLNPVEDKNLPFGIFRITFSEKDYASKAEELLSDKLLDIIFKVLNQGRSSMLKNRENDALAIADLQTDLLQYRYRTEEFSALDELAFHIKTLFDECECSIFLANKRPENSKFQNIFDLHLAATTAKSLSAQHQTFRKTFYEEHNKYTCYFDSDGNPIGDKFSIAAKTERAFYKPDSLVVDNKNLGSTLYPQKGEMQDAGSFLGLAIPPSSSNKFPYGVIRIIRKTKDPFNKKHRCLAAAIAKALTYWLDFFPKNDELQIEWGNNESNEFKENVLCKLFLIDPLKPHESNHSIQAAELEFFWLLQKIFLNSRKIILKKLFSGKSGTVVLLVENDSGLDLILKCSRRESNRKDSDNNIWIEISNYRKYIEGKLELNHNVIYPELIRETRELIGFATSFLNSRNRTRISITDFCKRERDNLRTIELSLTRVFDNIFTCLWSWWYEPKQLGQTYESNEITKFVENLEKDQLFSFFEDMGKFNNRVFPELKSISTIKNILTSGQYPSPLEIWASFQNHLKKCSDTITWQETVTHGDAHGDNIFFDPDSLEIWMIDFSRTAKRISIFDLAMIESDLKFRHLPNVIKNDAYITNSKFLKIFSRFEEDLASQETYERIIIPKMDNEDSDPVLQMFAKLIIDIRQLACQRLLRTGTFTDYQILLFLLAFKFMKIQGISAERRVLPYFSAYTLQKIRFSDKKASEEIRPVPE